MKKQLRRIGTIILTTTVLVACSTAMMDKVGFQEAINKCATARTTLGTKYDDVASDDFDTIKKHIQEVVASPEFTNTEQACAAMETFDISHAKEEEKQIFIEFQTLSKQVSELQYEFYRAQANAPDPETYNKTREDYLEKGKELNPKMIDIFNRLKATYKT